MDIYEGTILTVDKDDDVCRYLVVDDGRVAYVGDELPAELAHHPVQSLEGRALAPSFVDTHEHFASFSTFNAGLNVMEARSNAEIMEMVLDFTRRSDAKTLIAFGASPYSVSEGRLLSREGGRDGQFLLLDAEQQAHLLIFLHHQRCPFNGIA